MRHIVFIYSRLTSYIVPVLIGMADSGLEIDVLSSAPPPDMGFEEITPPKHPNIHWIQVQEYHFIGKRLGFYQKGVLSFILHSRPDAVIIWANPRFITFWGVLILGRLLKIPIFPRGHGLFKYNHVSTFQKAMYKAILDLSYRYICYTPAVKRSLLPYVKMKDKLVVDYNTLYNQYPLKPNEKTGKEEGIFYLGRIRPGCGIDVLIQALQELNHHKSGINIELHVIGGGPLAQLVEEQASRFPWLYYYGKEYNQKRVRDISRYCRLGCVPGYMGLNVVHMFSLSLPVITHAKLWKHMGPEPEYINHGINGWLMKEENDVPHVMDRIITSWHLPTAKVKIFQKNAYQRYQELSNPPFHKRLLEILQG